MKKIVAMLVCAAVVAPVHAGGVLSTANDHKGKLAVAGVVVVASAVLARAHNKAQTRKSASRLQAPNSGPAAGYTGNKETKQQ